MVSSNGLQQEQHVSKSFEEYYFAVFRSTVYNSAPIAAGLFLGFFGWDLLFIKTSRQALMVLLLRVPLSLIIASLRWIVPRCRRLRTLEWLLGVLYTMVLTALVLILCVVPNGLNSGIGGMILGIMVGAFMCFQRPWPVIAGGVLAVVEVLVAGYLKGLEVPLISSAVIFTGSGAVSSIAFAIFLQRDLKRRHGLELSLAREKEQSEMLLKEILPRYVIQRIRDGADTIAESIAEVNIIFIDIVGFTAMARKLAPTHLVEVLGGLFRSFDELCERHGVTKIKTIGDAYMAVTGAPEPSSFSAKSAVEFCLCAIESVRETARQTGIPLQIRTGIATGAAISGVLSLKRPAYDLWGETVNLASRMEHTAEPGTVQIAEMTYWRVKDQFVCVPRGLVDVKGYGQVQTYVIAGRSHSDLSEERGTTTALL